MSFHTVTYTVRAAIIIDHETNAVITSQKAYYPALTGLRALAAYMVFFHHANPFHAIGWQSPLYFFTQELYIGVSLFFVLSGFLIYHRYADEIHKSQYWFVAYLQNRFARIYPLYFLILLLVIIIRLVKPGAVPANETFITSIINFTLLQGFFSDLKFTGIGQAWSLTVEECFYLTLPLLLVWKRKFSIFILPLLLFCTGVVLVWLFSGIHFYGFFSDFHFMMEYTFFGRCVEFFAGIGLAIYLKKEDKQNGRNGKYTYLSLLILIGLIAAMASLNNRHFSGIDDPMRLIIHNFILPFVEVTLIYGLIKEKTWLQKILSSLLLQIAGKSSYAFYLIHAGYLYAVMFHYISKNTIVIFVLMNVVAVLLYYGIEKPLQKRWSYKYS